MTTRRDLLAGVTAAAVLTPFAAGAQIAAQGAVPTPLRRLLDQFSEEALDRSPTTVTSLGLDTGARARQKSLLDDASVEAWEGDKARAEDQLKRLHALGSARVGLAEQLDYDVADYALSDQVARGRRFNWTGRPYSLSQLDGAYVGVPDFLDTEHTIANAEDAHAYLARLNAFAAAVDQNSEAAQHDAGLGVVAPAFALDKAIAQLKTLRDTPVDQAVLVQSVVRRAREKSDRRRLGHTRHGHLSPERATGLGPPDRSPHCAEEDRLQRRRRVAPPRWRRLLRQRPEVGDHLDADPGGGSRPGRATRGGPFGASRPASSAARA